MKFHTRPSLPSPLAPCCQPMALAVSVLGILAGSPAQAATQTWLGSADANLSTAANWAGSIVPAKADRLTFNSPGKSGTTLSNDLPPGLRLGLITFGPAAGAYTLEGNRFTLTGDLASSSPAPQTLATPIILSSKNHTLSSAAGGLNLSGNLTTGTGINGSVTIAGGGTTTFGGTNNFIHTNISGALVVQDNSTLAITGATRVSGTAPGGGGFQIGSNAASTNTVTLASGASLTLAGSTHAIQNGTCIGQQSVGVLTLNGGTFSQTNATMGFVIGDTGDNAGVGSSLNINAGSEMILATGTAHTQGDYVILGRQGGRGTIHLNGGVLATGRAFGRGGNSGNGKPSAAIFNFNGGTLKAGADNRDWLTSVTTPNALGAGNPVHALTATTVKAGGARIDTNGFSVGINTVLAHDAALGEAADGGLTKNGPGTLTLGGASTYTGATTINAGAVVLGVSEDSAGAGALGAGTGALSLGDGSTLDLAGHQVTVGSLAVSGTAGGGATITSTSTARIKLTGAPVNLTGLTVLGSTTLEIASEMLTLPGVAVFSGAEGALRLSSDVGRQNNLSSVLGNATLILDGRATSLETTTNQTIVGNLVVNGSNNVWSYHANTEVNGTLTGSGTLSANPGHLSQTFFLKGDCTRFEGTLAWDAGTATGTTLVLQHAGAATVGAGLAKIKLTGIGAGVLLYRGGGDKIVALGELSGTGNWKLENHSASTTATWLVGGLNTSAAFAGVIADNGKAHSALTKTGSGTQTLTGANTFSGATVVAQGTLVAGNALALGTTAAGTSVTGGATLDVQADIGFEAISTGGAGVDGRGALATSTGSGIVGGTVTLVANTSIGGTGRLNVGGVIAGAEFGIAKVGAGTTTLGAASTYTGATAVNGGSLMVNNTEGSGLGTGNVTVGNRGTLGGTGAFTGSVTVKGGGTLAPGDGVQALAGGGLSFDPNSIYSVEFDSLAMRGTEADLFVADGDLNLAGDVELRLTDIASTRTGFFHGKVFSLLNYTGTWNKGSFTFGGKPLADGDKFTAGLNTWQITYESRAGGDNFPDDQKAGSFVNITAVPAPVAPPRGILARLLNNSIVAAVAFPSGTALLGAIGMMFVLRRRKVV